MADPFSTATQDSVAAFKADVDFMSYIGRFSDLTSEKAIKLNNLGYGDFPYFQIQSDAFQFMPTVTNTTDQALLVLQYKIISLDIRLDKEIFPILWEMCRVIRSFKGTLFASASPVTGLQSVKVASGQVEEVDEDILGTDGNGRQYIGAIEYHYIFGRSDF